MQSDLHRLVLRKEIEKRPVAVFEGLLKDVIEVADRLVIVEGQNQSDSVGHSGCVLWFVGERIVRCRSPWRDPRAITPLSANTARIIQLPWSENIH